MQCGWKSWLCGKKAKMMMFLLTASRLAELIMQRGDFKKVSRAACWFFYYIYSVSVPSIKLESFKAWRTAMCYYATEATLQKRPEALIFFKKPREWWLLTIGYLKHFLKTYYYINIPNLFVYLFEWRFKSVTKYYQIQRLLLCNFLNGRGMHLF